MRLSPFDDPLSFVEWPLTSLLCCRVVEDDRRQRIELDVVNFVDSTFSVRHLEFLFLKAKPRTGTRAQMYAISGRVVAGFREGSCPHFGVYIHCAPSHAAFVPNWTACRTDETIFS